MTLESFVVRIYRRPTRTGRGMVGVIEGERTGGQRAFCSAGELWDLLVQGSRRGARPAAPQEPAAPAALPPTETTRRPT